MLEESERRNNLCGPRDQQSVSEEKMSSAMRKLQECRQLATGLRERLEMVMEPESPVDSKEEQEAAPILSEIQSIRLIIQDVLDRLVV